MMRDIVCCDTSMLFSRVISRLLWTVLATKVLASANVEAYCTFPHEWRGQWHQNRIGDIIISTDDISRKGRCVESKHDFYVLENREYGCYTCLQITQRHDNILQYKESYCEGKDTLLAICEQIKITTIEQILIRVPSAPIPCPFHDAYHFSYNNNSGGFCREPASYAKPCASAAQIRLHFKHCPNAAYTYDTAVDLECLGVWREGSEQYLIGKLTGGGFRRNDNRYKCFMYSVIGTLVYASMSADASCFGVISPRNGPVVLEFTQDVFGWPVPACEFPQWIARTNWKDLSGRHVYETNALRTIVSEVYKSDVQSVGGEQKAYRCHRLFPRNNTDDEFTLVSFTSHECTSKYQCVKFVKRKDGVIELHEGMFMEYETDRCQTSHVLTSNAKLLIPEDVEARHCPLRGRYRIHTGSRLCTGYFRVGCNGTSVLDILSSCSSKPGMQLECLKSWKEDKKRYLVARLLGDTTGTTNCFSFRKRDQNLYFSIDNECNRGTPLILRDFVTYVLDQDPDECDMPEKVTKEVRSDNRSSRDGSNDDIQYGGSYKHVDEQNSVYYSRSRAGTLHYTSCQVFILFVVFICYNTG